MGWQESTDAKETLPTCIRIQLEMLNKQTAPLKHHTAALWSAGGMAVP